MRISMLLLLTLCGALSMGGCLGVNLNPVTVEAPDGIAPVLADPASFRATAAEARNLSESAEPPDNADALDGCWANAFETAANQPAGQTLQRFTLLRFDADSGAFRRIDVVGDPPTTAVTQEGAFEVDSSGNIVTTFREVAADDPNTPGNDGLNVADPVTTTNFARVEGDTLLFGEDATEFSDIAVSERAVFRKLDCVGPPLN